MRAVSKTGVTGEWSTPTIITLTSLDRLEQDLLAVMVSDRPVLIPETPEVERVSDATGTPNQVAMQSETDEDVSVPADDLDSITERSESIDVVMSEWAPGQQ